MAQKHDQDELENIRESLRSDPRMASLEEQQHINGGIHKLEDDIVALDNEIARLKATRMEKEASLEELRSFIAPHRMLPSEILALIFEHTRPFTPDNPLGSLSIPSMLNHTSSPWNIRQVCSHWRQIALSTRTLWNNLSFEWTEKEKRQKKGSLSTWEARIHTTGTMILPGDGPLYLQFCYDYDYDNLAPPDGEVINIVIDFLEPRQDRIFSLSFRCIAMFYLFTTTYTTRRISLPNMTSLSWLPHWESDPDEVELFTPRTDKAASIFSELIPRTHTLSLSGDKHAFDQYLHFIKTSNISRHLTTLHLLQNLESFPNDEHRWQFYSQALSQCSRLKSLTLLLYSSFPFPPEPQEAFLPDLESLTVATTDEFVLDTFTLPSLSCLRYKSNDKFLSRPLAELINRSQCSLKTFIEYPNSKTRNKELLPVDRQQWDELLAHLHSVEEFETATLFDKDDLSRLGEAKILPSTRRLEIAVNSQLVAETYELLKNRFWLPSYKQPKLRSRIYSVGVAYRPPYGALLLRKVRERLQSDTENARMQGTHLNFLHSSVGRFREKMTIPLPVS